MADNRVLKRIVKWARQNPQKLFCIDGVGALLSAFLLGFVLVRWSGLFGIPMGTLYFLATWPLFFAVYDFYCYRRKDHNFGSSLKVIGCLNLMYCCLSVGFAVYHRSTVTWIGWLYIVSEISIVVCLATVELIVSKKPALS